jgi:ADYC domain
MRHANEADGHRGALIASPTPRKPAPGHKTYPYVLGDPERETSPGIPPVPQLRSCQGATTGWAPGKAQCSIENSIRSGVTKPHGIKIGAGADRRDVPSRSARRKPCAFAREAPPHHDPRAHAERASSVRLLDAGRRADRPVHRCAVRGDPARQGTLIHVCDRFGIRPCAGAAPMAFEAAWGVDGATCVARTRVPRKHFARGPRRALPAAQAPAWLRRMHARQRHARTGGALFNRSQK